MGILVVSAYLVYIMSVKDRILPVILGIYAGAPCRYVKDRNQNMKQLRAVLQNSGEYEESR